MAPRSRRAKASSETASSRCSASMVPLSRKSAKAPSQISEGGSGSLARQKRYGSSFSPVGVSTLPPSPTDSRELEQEYLAHREMVLAMLRAEFGGLRDHEELYQEAWAEAL